MLLGVRFPSFLRAKTFHSPQKTNFYRFTTNRVRFSTNMSGIKSQDEILHFWFGDLESANAAVDPAKIKMWYGGADGIDDVIRTKFGETFEAAATGNLVEEWKGTPKGDVALIILLDQFSRNIHRGSGKDATALKICLEAMEQKRDLQLFHPFHRVFLYHPLMHGESKEIQQKSVEAFQAILKDVSPDHPNYGGFKENLRFAILHQEIIEKFGRYPGRYFVFLRTHIRNKALGRESTPEELKAIEEGLLF